jgi:hypothetical protein
MVYRRGDEIILNFKIRFIKQNTVLDCELFLAPVNRPAPIRFRNEIISFS